MGSSSHSPPEMLAEKNFYEPEDIEPETEAEKWGLPEEPDDNEGSNEAGVDRAPGKDEQDTNATTPHDLAPARSQATTVRSVRSFHPDPNTFPDGGLKAWLQVVGGFFLFFNSWGLINTFGAFQTYYETTLLFSTPPSTISWVGSIQGFLLLFLSSIAGPLLDAGYYRWILFTGLFLTTFGMMMTSLAKEYYQVLLAQGICAGAGTAFVFMPSVAIPSTYFNKKRALANGIAAAGSSVGAVLYPIIFRKLVPQIGFGWTTRLIGFLIFGTVCVSISLMRTRLPPGRRRRLVDLSAWKEPVYTIYVLGVTIGFVGLYVPFFYMPTYAIRHGVNDSLAYYLVAVLNAASVFGRLLPNYAADKLGPLTVLIPCSIISTLLAFCWIAIKSQSGILAFCVFYGFSTGTFVSMPPPAIASFTKDFSRLGGRMGMCFGVAAFGVLIGTPVAGAILGPIDADHLNWLGVQIFSGVMLGVSTVMIVVARWLKAGLRMTKA